MMYNTTFQPRRRWRFPLIGILILLIVIGSIGFLVNKVQGGNVITVDSGTTLFIDSCSGFVHIHANSSSNQVVIQGLSSIFAPASHAQDSDTIIINGCDLDITVPASINLKIDADEIDVFGVSGVMNLSTNGGPIILMQDTLKGKSVLDNNGGPVIFQGALDSAANATFSSNGGSIDISLPGNAAFHLKTAGNLDTLTTNFPGVVAGENGVPDTSVGSSPQATLTLDVNGSSVILNKA